MTLLELEAEIVRTPEVPLAASVCRALPATQRPWQPSGLRLAAGQAYTLLASGVVHWSARHPHLHGGPGFHLYARVHPGGRMVNLTRSSGSFIADVDGHLEFAIYLGRWRDAFGALDTPAAAYARLRGEIEVLALAWQGAATDGVARLAARHAHPLIAAEHARLLAPAELPAGWDYLIETGTSDIYRACHAHGATPRICLDAADDQGILRKAVSWPLVAGTRLVWRWRLDLHPSSVPEDTPYTHDYVAVAAEFDDGRDLTWSWSAGLPRDHHFPCPIRAWQARETHWVVRNAQDPLGAWLHEERAVHSDVATAMGAPPQRIVAVWLIAVATFQHQRARAAFEGIELVDGARRLQVL